MYAFECENNSDLFAKRLNIGKYFFCEDFLKFKARNNSHYKLIFLILFFLNEIKFLKKL